MSSISSRSPIDQAREFFSKDGFAGSGEFRCKQLYQFVEVGRGGLSAAESFGRKTLENFPGGG